MPRCPRTPGLPVRGAGPARALRIGLGGPVGSGKTATVAALCRALRDELSIAVVTNDIYTREDAEFLLREAVLPAERIVAVETGACPHTAIRDDISANLEAVEDLEDAVGPLDLMLVESGGDNLTATFSKGLVDAQIFVIDVAGGDDIPRKGGPGVTTADLLVVNKTDLAPYVGADLDRMARDAAAQRGDLPVVFTSLAREGGIDPVADWVGEQLAAWTAVTVDHRGGARRALPGADQGRRGRARRHRAAACSRGTGRWPCAGPGTGADDARVTRGRRDERAARRRPAADRGARWAAGARLHVGSAAATVALPGAAGEPRALRRAADGRRRAPNCAGCPSR